MLCSPPTKVHTHKKVSKDKISGSDCIKVAEAFSLYLDKYDIIIHTTT